MYELLQKIKSPAELKKLPIDRLDKLASEIREVLVNVVANNGGHLAANLGVVELTIALHYVYDAPRDRIIWDVGHQSYTHKMLTGRFDEIESLRCYGGLSGFPKRSESPYDAFDTGHSSTSISAAVGMAIGRDLAGEDYKVLAVIGDGALTGGMAYEALNHAGHLGLDVTVILNDNEMSISKNVGAMSTYLSKLRSDPAYARSKQGVEHALSRVPVIGPGLLRTVTKAKNIIKYAVVPTMIFEELGFTYIGPVDGHNIEAMIGVLQRAKRLKSPVLVHVITQKGRGYEPALKNPDAYHGIGPFDIDTGEQLKSQTRTFTRTFGEWILSRAEKDPRLVAITAAMESGTGLSEFARRFPSRFFDVGICEQHAVTMAAGMACTGLKPVVAIYSTFLQRAFDQIIHDVCLQELPVVFAIDRAGLVGEDGPTHHGVFDLSYLRQIPNMIIMAPAHEEELVDMLDAALEYERPVAVRYPRGASGHVADDYRSGAGIKPGQAQLIQEGEQLLFIGIGRGTGIAVHAAEILRKQGLKPAVINARFVKPLDEELITQWAERCRRVVTIEDNVLAGGFGSAVLELLHRNTAETDILCLGIPDDFVQHGRVDQLLFDLGLTPSGVVDSIMRNWPDLRKVRMFTGG